MWVIVLFSVADVVSFLWPPAPDCGLPTEDADSVFLLAVGALLGAVLLSPVAVASLDFAEEGAGVFVCLGTVDEGSGLGLAAATLVLAGRQQSINFYMAIIKKYFS
jgi:hypothetical protein